MLPGHPIAKTPVAIFDNHPIQQSGAVFDWRRVLLAE